ncbi:uncharacterized protein LOC119078008 isoform X1 [Bradysia coprophila]|uniref:uncharacterized protein LOC119078008 isoform X1 n=1 Tax=Bradysia coprophila TaxID=38358 RepID=UPI00187DC7F2|nr:uncharacterized protein LOC119078008 isoform X1 [Bradysia coprophila]
MLAIAALLAVHAGLAGSISTAPENITVTFLNPTSVKVSWQTSVDLLTPVEKYDVTYKPTDASYRVVAVVAGNSEAVTLIGLTPDTQYQLTVTAVFSGKKFRSRPIVFRTLEPPRSSPQQDSGALPKGYGAPGPPQTDGMIPVTFTDEYVNISENATTRELPTIRGVEVGIVVLVLIVWAGAIALFFNRWGKIRMLLPYQPDYKQEQLKVPGTGVCSSGGCNGQHSHQHFHHAAGWQEEPSTAISERCSRNRINSAIFVSSGFDRGRGFDSIEFLRRHGSQSVLCRKARSAENITDEDRRRRFSENREWETDDSGTLRETIELVECHNGEPSSMTDLENNNPTVTNKIPKLINLPTLSISGPSPPHDDDFL